MPNPRTDALWSHVHLLTVIAQAGSFTQAAQRLALSKAAVSQRIADLERAVGLTLVQRNYRVAHGPRSRGGEVDLIVRDRDGTLVFVEVRARQGDAFGGAAASDILLR